MKQCTKCKKWKDESCFFKEKKGKNGLRSMCKICDYKITKAHRKLPHVHQKFLLTARKNNLKKEFGITIAQYDEMFEQQNGVCAICGKKETMKNQYGVRRLSVDHDHKTGKIRGLLCAGCNFVLGTMKDSKERILKAAIYLEQHNG